MSHSDNNIDRQVRRHKGPLIGFVVLGIFVAGLLVWWLGSEFGESDGPDGAPVQIDGRTGDRVEGSTDDTDTGATPDTGAVTVDPAGEQIDPAGQPQVAPQPQVSTPTD